MFHVPCIYLGGFVYFDAHGRVCKVFAVSARQPHEHAVYSTRTRSDTPSGRDEGTVGSGSESSELTGRISLSAAASAALFTVAVGSTAPIRLGTYPYPYPNPFPHHYPYP